MREFTRTLANPARIFLIILWGVLCCLIFLAPLLAAHSNHPFFAALLYLFFAPVCHQNGARSFHIAGHALTVCHRCTGIYLGLLLGSLVPIGRLPLYSSARGRRLLVFVSTVPLILDVALPFVGVWTNGPVSRAITGLIFGAMLSTLLVSGVAEIVDGLHSRSPQFGNSHIEGEISWIRKACSSRRS